MPPNCSAVASLLDAHFLSSSQQVGRSTLVAFHGGNGLGDEVEGFLIALVTAMATGRRLEIARQASSYLSSGFVGNGFDLSYTGDQRYLDLVQPAINAFDNVTVHCYTANSLPPNSTCGGCANEERQQYHGRCAKREEFCCVSRKNHYLPRVMPYQRYPSFQEHGQIAGGALGEPSSPLLDKFGITLGRMYGNSRHLELITVLKDQRARASTFNRPIEFLAGFAEGGGGRDLFHWYILPHVPPNDRADALGCTLRHLLQPSLSVLNVMEQQRPVFWPRLATTTFDAVASHHTAAPQRKHQQHIEAPRVAIHVRAVASLINRRMRNDDARY